MTGLSEGGAAPQLSDSRLAIERAAHHPPDLFRPPYGATNRKINRESRGLGMVPVYWDVDCEDYATSTGKKLARCVLDHVLPGSIVLLHDGGGNRSTTVAALPLILKGLRKRGLACVTVEELLNRWPPSEGGLMQRSAS